MSYGFDLGRLKTTSTGLSYVDSFAYGGGTVGKSYQAPAFEFATDVRAFVLPGVNIPANQVPVFPSVVTSLNQATKTIAVTASGGNVQSTILVFVR
jgi:hypothetical protein